MGERGRKSSASLATVPTSASVVSLKRRPDPWAGLNQREVELWKGIVDSQAVDWFSPGDEPLLMAYVRAIALHEKASRQMVRQRLVLGDDSINPLLKVQDMAAKQVANLAVKLRLAQSAKWTEQKAATKVKHGGQAQNPWGA